MTERKRKILFTTCILICVVCAAYVLNYYIKKDKKQNDIAKIQKEVVKEQKKPNRKKSRSQRKTFRLTLPL